MKETQEGIFGEVEREPGDNSDLKERDKKCFQKESRWLTVFNTAEWSNKTWEMYTQFDNYLKVRGLVEHWE